MKVRDLIELLQKQEQDAEVFMLEQPSWPFEHSIRGITTRRDVLEHERDDALTIHDDCELEYARDGKKPSDVFIVEGDNVRYGAKAAWLTVKP